MAKQTVTVYLNEDRLLFLEDMPIDLEGLKVELSIRLMGDEEASVVLRADKSVPVQYIVNVIDVVEGLNREYQTRHKVILATQPAR